VDAGRPDRVVPIIVASKTTHPRPTCAIVSRKNRLKKPPRLSAKKRRAENRKNPQPQRVKLG
jgi:hypothetical protein